MAPFYKSPMSLKDLFVLALAAGAIYRLYKTVYNLFFHPLAAFPGPTTHRISRLPRIVHLVRGRLPFHVAQLHAKYGPVVRVAPNELAFCDPRAWKDIYGHRQQGQEELSKETSFYRPVPSTPTTILSADREEHGLIRRQLSHGFSDRSMRAQEDIVGSHVQLLIQRLRENGGGGAAALNMREWLNWTTFDIIGDLGFGSSFGCLENSDYHPWVRLVSRANKATSIMQAISSLGGGSLLDGMLNGRWRRGRPGHREALQAKIMQRMELGAQRPDLIEGLLRKQDEWQMPIDKIRVNASRLIVAGSETTSTLLSGALFLLTANEDKLARLTQEVRTHFENDQEITLNTVSNLPYMLACLNETLRMYPPVPIGLPRVSPNGGTSICGHFVPAGATVSVWHWAINHDEKFWTDPWEFRPERFLGDPRYEGDHLEALQPFSVGPRNCIGKNLALAEMRLILAKIVFSFDMHLDDGSKDWIERQKAYFLWEKSSLDVYMTPVSS